MFSPFDVALGAGVPAPASLQVFAASVPAELRAAREFEWLTHADAARARAIARPERRAQFATGRWLLRHAAARIFGESGFRLGSVDGRPIVTAAAGEPAAVSLSHSGELVLCAAGRLRSLGVDVERVRPRADWHALCAWTLHPRERERIERARESRRWPSFYQSWTYKEALAKALGEGVFGLPFDRILVSPDGRLESADERLESGPPDARLRDPDWRLAALRLGEGFAGAVAWRA